MKGIKLILSKIDYGRKLLVMFMSLLVIGAIVVDYGFVLDASEMALIHKIYAIGWWTYIISFTFQLIYRWKDISRKAISLTTIIGSILYFTIMPCIFKNTGDLTWLSSLWAFLHNKYFIIGLLGLFSLIELSKGITGFINRKTNPALLTVACFAITIVFGALLLMLPRSTMEHIRIPMIDALFVSTSAVCVTGLSIVEVAHTFTMEGQIIIALLIQIGGLGIMTITSFFAIFFMDGMGLYSQFTLRDMLSSSAESLMSLLLHVLGFTIVIEFIGAFLIWLSIHSTMDMSLSEEIFFSVFHSISAFCNAGFSTLEGNLGNEAIITGHNSMYMVISVLIILGGIGFPVLINLKRWISYYWSGLMHKIGILSKPRARYSHVTDLNTKIVLWTTAGLVFGGAAIIALLEWDGAFAIFSNGEKVVQAFFNSVVPRTAGFNSVSTGEFSRLTILLLIILMWIGGASQSTAGGIKVNTLAVAFASIKSIIKGRQATELFNKEITYNSIRRTLAVIFGSIVIILAFFVILLILEPGMSSLDILFETVSAFSTVGSSMGITQFLCNESKFMLVLLMFIGRVGFITVLMSFVSRSNQARYRLPKEDIIIN